jgi:CheY-like chemotaxis protein
MRFWKQGVLSMAVSAVMVVADVETDRARLERIVSNGGYNVIRTCSGAEALAAISDEKPDLVLLDVVTDDMDGFRICRDLQNNPSTRGIPVIMVSSGSQRVDSLWAAQQGASGHIAKPYTAEQVLEQIRRFD